MRVSNTLKLYLVQVVDFRSRTRCKRTISIKGFVFKNHFKILYLKFDLESSFDESLTRFVLLVSGAEKFVSVSEFHNPMNEV